MSVPTLRSHSRRPRSRATLALVALTACASCRSPAADPPDAATSPQAQAEPAPLAQLPSAAGGGAAADGDGGLIEAFRIGEVLAPDVVREPVRESLGRDGGGREVREPAGIALQAVVRTGEGPPAPRASEVNAAAIEAARRKLEARLSIELASGRARFVFSGGFVLPPSSDLRSRLDRYGHLLFWGGDADYRIVEPGALRALLGERRLDVSPLSPAEFRAAGEGPRRLGLRTRRVEIAARAAKATFEVASLGAAGDGGPLVCRFLLDLMSVAPNAAGGGACGADEVPLHAELRWTTRGALSFDVTSIGRRSEASLQSLAVPPASASLVTSPPPAVPAELLLARTELAAFRSAPVDLPASAAHGSQPPPEAGLLLINSSDELRVVWIDGVPVAWVAAAGRLALNTMLRGRYVLQWRTFLGDGWEAPDAMIAPGVSEVGSAAR